MITLIYHTIQNEANDEFDHDHGEYVRLLYWTEINIRIYHFQLQLSVKVVDSDNRIGKSTPQQQSQPQPPTESNFAIIFSGMFDVTKVN